MKGQRRPDPGLPPFNSPRSMIAVIRRQNDREIHARVDWGTPASATGSAQLTDDGRSDHSVSDAIDELDDPPELDLDRVSDPSATTPGENPCATGKRVSYRYKCSARPRRVRKANYRRDNMATALAPAAGSVSPSSSPRLPSPPPFPEVQIGPKSPTPGAQAGAATQDVDEAAKLDSGSIRRIRPGTKAADMASGPPLVPLSELDSPFQLQEHLKALYYHLTKSDANNTTVPISHETALTLSTPPENVDRSLWLYELCRFLVQKANNLIVAFFADSPPCSAQTCPEMRASEWQYLCAVHDPPKSCCAIDYCCHTLDWAANILTSQKHFPSRLTLGSEAAGGSQQGVKQLTNIFRRVYRIFAHAWFQHRQVFWQVESHEGLYIFFKTVCDIYNLIPEDNYTVPPEAEGISTENEYRGNEQATFTETASSGRQGNLVETPKEDEEVTEDNSSATMTTMSTGATTRRHKHTPSLGSVVTTIAEGDEDEPSSAGDTTAQPNAAPESPPKSVTRSSTAVFSRAEAPEEEDPSSDEPATDISEKLKDLTVDDRESINQEKETDAQEEIGKAGSNVGSGSDDTGKMNDES